VNRALFIKQLDPTDRRSKTRLVIPLRVVLVSESSPAGSVPDGVVSDISLENFSFHYSVSLKIDQQYQARLFAETKEIGGLTFLVKRLMPIDKNGFEIGATFVDFDEGTLLNLLGLMERRLQQEGMTSFADRRKTTRRNQRALTKGLRRNRIERRSSMRESPFEDHLSSLEPLLRKQFFGRVVVTGLGVVSPIGIGRVPFSEGLKAGRIGVKEISKFDCSEFACTVAGQVDDEELRPHINLRESKRFDRSTLLAWVAARLALDDASIKVDAMSARRIGLAVGTSAGGIGWVFEQYERMKIHGVHGIHPYTIAAGSPNACSSEIMINLGLRGPCISLSQGCASSAGAIEYGFQKIREKKAAIMLVGGTEAPLTYPLYAAFSRAGVLSSGKSLPRPFDSSRGGMVLGEGAGFLVLEDYGHAVARHAKIYAEIMAIASTCDSHDMVVPDPSGIEPSHAMQNVLQEASIEPSQLDVIFAHAPGTKTLDSMEDKAIRRLLLGMARSKPVTNIKSAVGYTQGACVALEAAAACLAIRENFLPGITTYKSGDDKWLDVVSQTRYQPVKMAMVNCFGFGGKNYCLLLSAPS